MRLSLKQKELKRRWMILVLGLLLGYSTYIQIEKSLIMRDLEKQIHTTDEKLEELSLLIAKLNMEKDGLVERIQSSADRYEEDKIRLLEAQENHERKKKNSDGK